MAIRVCRMFSIKINFSTGSFLFGEVLSVAIHQQLVFRQIGSREKFKFFKWRFFV
jgi:hypothetical protein